MNVAILTSLYQCFKSQISSDSLTVNHPTHCVARLHDMRVLIVYLQLPFKSKRLGTQVTLVNFRILVFRLQTNCVDNENIVQKKVQVESVYYVK